MKRTLGVLLLLTLAAVPAHADEDPLTAEQRAWVDAHGPIRYAPDPDYPPFEFVRPDGTVEGVNVDLINRMSRNLDIEFETVIYPNWTAVLDGMRAGEVDLLGSVAQNEERETYMDFIGPYMEVGEVFYVTIDRTDLAGIGDLAGKQVAVVQNYAAAAWLAENHPEMNLVPVPDMLSGLEAVSTGQVDAFFENIPVAGYYIRQNSMNNIRILGDPLYYSPANWAVPDGEHVLKSIIETGLASIPLGEQTKVFEYWTGYDLGVRQTPDAPPVSPLAWGIIGGLALIVALAGAWTVTLRRTVAHRTEDLAKSKAEVEASKQQLEARVAQRTRELAALTEREGHLVENLDAQVRHATVAMKHLGADLRSRYHGVLRPDTVGLLEAAEDGTRRYAHTLLEAQDMTRAELSGDPTSLATSLKEAAAEIGRGRVPIESASSKCAYRGADRLARSLVAYASLHGSPIRLEEDPCRVRFVGGAREDVEHALTPQPGEPLHLPVVARILHAQGRDVEAANDGEDLVLTFS